MPRSTIVVLTFFTILGMGITTGFPDSEDTLLILLLITVILFFIIVPAFNGVRQLGPVRVFSSLLKRKSD